VFVGRIHVGRLRLELGGAGVDALELRGDAEVGRARRMLLSSRPVSLARRASVKPIILSAQALLRHRQAVAADLVLGLHDLADAGEEPRVEAGHGGDVVIAEPVAHGLRDDAQPVGGLRGSAPW
jgi:hypothetical protein